jgi:hypothetical protein
MNNASLEIDFAGAALAVNANGLMRSIFAGDPAAAIVRVK